MAKVFLVRGEMLTEKAVWSFELRLTIGETMTDEWRRFC